LCLRTAIIKKNSPDVNNGALAKGKKKRFERSRVTPRAQLGSGRLGGKSGRGGGVGATVGGGKKKLKKKKKGVVWS